MGSSTFGVNMISCAHVFGHHVALLLRLMVFSGATRCSMHPWQAGNNSLALGRGQRLVLTHPFSHRISSPASEFLPQSSPKVKFHYCFEQKNSIAMASNRIAMASNLIATPEDALLCGLNATDVFTGQPVDILTLTWSLVDGQPPGRRAKVGVLRMGPHNVIMLYIYIYIYVIESYLLLCHICVTSCCYVICVFGSLAFLVQILF